MIDPELQKILNQQDERLEKVEQRLKKIQSHMRNAAIASWLRLFVIIVPLVLGYIYLTPYINSLIAQYQQLMSAQNQAVERLENYLPR